MDSNFFKKILLNFHGDKKGGPHGRHKDSVRPADDGADPLFYPPVFWREKKLKNFTRSKRFSALNCASVAAPTSFKIVAALRKNNENPEDAVGENSPSVSGQRRPRACIIFQTQ